MRIRANYFVTISLLMWSTLSFAGCPAFQTALEQAIARATARTAEKVLPKGEPILTTAVKPKAKSAKATVEETSSVPTEKWSSPEAHTYKTNYKEEPISDSGNRSFISSMEDDIKLAKEDVLYFDVENSIQKKLNDSIVGDKGMVDAINNSFMEKFSQNLQKSPEILSRLKGKYKDYKSLRLRLVLKPGDNKLELEAKLNAIYQATNREFVSEFEKNGLTKLLPPRTDEVPDVDSWFLSGTGDSAIEANMIARRARSLKGGANGKTLSYRDHVETMHADVLDIENLRKGLASSKELLDAGILIKTAEGAIIPSKSMIGILRKIKPSDCATPAEYAAKIRSKVKTIFDRNISDKEIGLFTEYFQKVDAISPPIFQRLRTVIDLSKAEEGLVSVDFTGVGVDNAFAQMKALSAVDYVDPNKASVLKNAFGKMQENVEGVTKVMNMAKREFSAASASTNPRLKESLPQFTGDDGMHFPHAAWVNLRKQQLVRRLGRSGDPSKYRVTFEKTNYSNGVSIPGPLRSSIVVRAEIVEKDLRELIIGKLKISPERAEKMIFAIDSLPNEGGGGKFNLFIGGVKTTDAEKKLIEEALPKTLGSKEILGQILEAY